MVNYYAEDFSFELSDREYRGEEAEAKTTSMLYEKGLITRNEGRAKVGYDPLEGGDVFVSDSSHINAFSKNHNVDNNKSEVA